MKREARLIAGLTTLKPWAGVRLTVWHFFCLNSLLLLTFGMPNLPSFFLMSVVTGFYYAAVLMTTHDAIHHTLTGWPWFDEASARLFSYFVFWPHGVYAELHKLHHKLNGRDLADPENPTPSAAEYERAGALGRFLLRHRWWLGPFVYGGFGMIIKHSLAARKISRANPAMRRAMHTDTAGIAAAAAVTATVLAYSGLTWRYGLYLLTVERVIGYCQQLRSFIEHYGLWGEHEDLVKTRLYNCRNIATARWVSRFFNGLNYHSVHHAFPRIPYYHLAEAHARLGAACAEEGVPLLVGQGYLRTLRELGRHPTTAPEGGTHLKSA